MGFRHYYRAEEGVRAVNLRSGLFLDIIVTEVVGEGEFVRASIDILKYGFREGHLLIDKSKGLVRVVSGLHLGVCDGSNPEGTISLHHVGEHYKFIPGRYNGTEFTPKERKPLPNPA